MIVWLSIAIIVVVTIIILEKNNEKNEKKKDEERQKRCQEYAHSMMESNRQFFELEEKCREYERQERLIEDLRYEAKARQKRRAAHKRRVYKK